MITKALSLLAIFYAMREGIVVSKDNKKHADAFYAIEEALLSSRSQRNLLQETFFSSSHPPPTLLIVTYNVTTASSNEMYTIGWSSSSVFAVINPETIWALQSGILSLAFFLEEIAVPRLVILDLNLTQSAINQRMSSKEITEVLKSITERLKPYAINQERLTKWDGSNMGFIWDTENSSKAFLVIIVIADVLLILFASIFSVKLLVTFSRKAVTKEATIEIGLLWSLVSVALVPNAIELLYLFITIIFTESQTFAIIKATILSMALLLALIGALISCVCNKNDQRSSTQKGQCCFSKLCCTCCAGCFILCNFFLFIYFTVLNIIPVTILMAVHPVIVLSTVTFIYTSFFCVVQVFALCASFNLISEKFQSSQNEEELKQQCSRLCKISLYLLPLVAVALLMVPYLEILSSTAYTHSSELINDLASFFPSIIVGAIGLFARQKLQKNSKSSKETNERELPDDDQSDPMKMAEEGESQTIIPDTKTD